MAEYIEREATLHRMIVDIKPPFAVVRDMPAADVVEVRHARFEWGYQNGQYGIWCTDCGAGWVDSENAEWIAREHKYCPNCGAKMDGATDTNVGGKNVPDTNVGKMDGKG